MTTLGAAILRAGCGYYGNYPSLRILIDAAKITLFFDTSPVQAYSNYACETPMRRNAMIDSLIKKDYFKL